jgi:phage shock protein A
MRDEHVDVSHRLRQAVSGLTEALDPFRTGLAQTLGQVNQLQEQLKNSTAEAMKAQAATTEVLQHLTKLTRDVTDVIRSAGHDPYARS